MPDPAVAEVPSTSTPASPSPTSSTPVTPTTQAAATTTAPSERPNDAPTLSPTATRDELGKFLAAQDRPADATTPQSPLVADGAAAATVQPTEPIVPGAPDAPPAQGPIPFDKHERIVANTRTKAVAEHMQSIGLPPTFTKENAAWSMDMARRMQDPVAFHAWLGKELAANPNYRAAVQPATPAPVKPQPDVEIRDDRGQVVGMGYSAAKQDELLAWNQQQMEGKFAQMLSPFQQDRDKQLEKQRLDALHVEQEKRADATLTHVNRILRMETLAKDDQAALGAKLLDEMSRTPNAIEAALIVAERDVYPLLEKKGQQAARDTDLKKAAANTANPGGSSAPSLRPDASKADLVAFLKRQDGLA